MNQHWDNLYSQTQDLYGISPNHFIQQIADQVPIVGKTLAIAEGEGRNILYGYVRGLFILYLINLKQWLMLLKMHKN